ncbi:MAG TPA: ATP-grasp domain-containing protein [Phycisphaerae bacterium]|nr:ATP-grasp domain-containing protein [Phycisphaerae bacterium]HRY69220.1 ATP-grasp domain-containing protein [Phycisphaerae bacterium]HSA26181.1 ATP-grasp domain-containing protein [Phycisphaerae bacterium]
MSHGAEWMIGSGAGRSDVRVLFTSGGRRIELMQAFARAARTLHLAASWHVVDVEAHYAAACMADHAHRVPRIASPGYIGALLRIVRREKIDLLVPLIDSDLVKLAEARPHFARLRCGVLISSPEVVATCRDKLRMFRFLSRQGIDTPQTWAGAELANLRGIRFPVFLKPCFGSASKGNFIVRDRKALKALVPLVPEAIIQEYVPGVEYTLDVYTGYDGQPRCVVPRQRIEVRGGEVTKSRTRKHAQIMAVGTQVARALAGCVGLITIQLILASSGRIRVIEVNPRFGGGAPLAIRAGADFPRWLLAEWLGRRPRIRADQFEDGLMMLRYHQSFFEKTSGAD